MNGPTVNSLKFRTATDELNGHANNNRTNRRKNSPDSAVTQISQICQVLSKLLLNYDMVGKNFIGISSQIPSLAVFSAGHLLREGSEKEPGERIKNSRRNRNETERTKGRVH